MTLRYTLKQQMFRLSLVFTAVLGAANLSGQSSPTAEDIVRKMDEMQTFQTMYAEGELTTEDRFGEKRSAYKAWSRGSEDFLIEFTNVEERGQKILRVDDELYLFYPDAEDIIPMHGAALKQSMFGDISYEDITEGSDTLDKYDVKMLGSELVDGEDSWVIEMIATSRDVPYPKQIIKVGKSDTILNAAEYYARSGRLLKTVEVLNVDLLDNGKIIISEMLLKDQLRRNSSTRMLISNVEINPDLSDDLFSLRSLY